MITGPLLVAAGRAQDPTCASTRTSATCSCPRTSRSRAGRRVDFGFDALVEDDALARDGGRGQAGHAAARRVGPGDDRVDAALEAIAGRGRARCARRLRKKGYREARARRRARDVQPRRATRSRVAFLEGHLSAPRARGRRSTAWSRRCSSRGDRTAKGTTVRDLAAALAKAGAEGGDPARQRRRRRAAARKSKRAPLRFEARPAEADRARTWPLRACLVWHSAR